MIFFKVTSYEKLSVLLDVDDKIIGGMELEIYSPYSALKKVWLNEQYRRKGIMSSVMPYLIKNLQNKSVQNIAVGCIEETAWKSYEKNGFKLLGKIPKWLGDAEQIWGSLDIV